MGVTGEMHEEEGSDADPEAIDPRLLVGLDDGDDEDPIEESESSEDFDREAVRRQVEEIKRDRDSWNREAIRTMPYEPAGPGTLEEIRVPRVVPTIPAAVHAAEMVQANAGVAPAILVDAGEYRWEDEIYVTTSYDLDVPPFAEIGNGTGMINNSSEAFRIESPVEMGGACRRDPDLQISGDPGALLWGAWVLEEGSRGAFRGVQLLRDTGDRGGACTVEMVASAFVLDGCGLRAVGGVCLRATANSSLAIKDCSIGGLGPSALCMGGVAAWDDAVVAAAGSVVSDGDDGSYGFRVIDAASASLAELELERLYVGVRRPPRGGAPGSGAPAAARRGVTASGGRAQVVVGGASRTELRQCAFRHMAQVAVHVDLDEDGEEGGAGRAGAERLPAVSLRDSSVEGRVWGPPGVTARALGPDKPLEKNVKITPGALEQDEDEAEVEAQTRELDAMLADVRDMMQPEEWLETIQRDEQGFPTVEGMCKVTADLARLNGVVARLTNGNVSIEERRDALGPDWADFMRAPFKEKVRRVEQGYIGLGEAVEESSTEPEEGRARDGEERVTLHALERNLQLMQGLYERLPPALRDEVDDTTLTRDIPLSLEKLRALRGPR